MSKLSAAEIEQHHKDDWSEQEADRDFEEIEYRLSQPGFGMADDENVDDGYDDWYDDPYPEPMDDPYYDPYPFDDDFYF